MSLMCCPQAEQETARIFRWNAHGRQWDSHRSSDATISFYNSIDEDEAASQTRWIWHLQAGDLDTEITQQYEYEASARRFRLLDESHKSWALVFSGLPSLHNFIAQWEAKLFENTHKLRYNKENAELVRTMDSIWPQMCCCLPSLAFAHATLL